MSGPLGPGIRWRGWYSRRISTPFGSARPAIDPARGRQRIERHSSLPSRTGSAFACCDDPSAVKVRCPRPRRSGRRRARIFLRWRQGSRRGGSVDISVAFEPDSGMRKARDTPPAIGQKAQNPRVARSPMDSGRARPRRWPSTELLRPGVTPSCTCAAGTIISILRWIRSRAASGSDRGHGHRPDTAGTRCRRKTRPAAESAFASRREIREFSWLSQTTTSSWSPVWITAESGPRRPGTMLYCASSLVLGPGRQHRRRRACDLDHLKTRVFRSAG